MTELLFLCEICGMVLEQHQCKATCPNCGRMLDCSDLPALTANGAVEFRNGEAHFIPHPPGGLQQQTDRARR
jgi:uncharacterized Zn finger protein (UPF0148 family)